MKGNDYFLLYPNKILPFKLWAHTCTRSKNLPQRGSCYIFPALLSHHVAPFKSDVTRISVSGNVTAVEQTNDEPNFMSRDKW